MKRLHFAEIPYSSSFFAPAGRLAPDGFCILLREAAAAQSSCVVLSTRLDQTGVRLSKD